MSRGDTFTTAKLIEHNFGPFEAHICIAEVNLLNSLGSLAILAQEMNAFNIHPDFSEDEKLRKEYEDPLAWLRPTRFGGPLEFAVQAMCDRNMFDRANLDQLLEMSGAFVGPLLFGDPLDENQQRLTHEVSVFLLPGE